MSEQPCEMCGTFENTARDHAPYTGEPRGILCPECKENSNVGDIAEFLHEVPEALEDLVAWLREQPSIIDSLPGNLRDIFELKLDKVMDKEMELRLMKVNGWVN